MSFSTNLDFLRNLGNESVDQLDDNKVLTVEEELEQELALESAMDNYFVDGQLEATIRGSEQYEEATKYLANREVSLESTENLSEEDKINILKTEFGFGYEAAKDVLARKGYDFIAMIKKAIGWFINIIMALFGRTNVIKKAATNIEKLAKKYVKELRNLAGKSKDADKISGEIPNSRPFSEMLTAVVASSLTFNQMSEGRDIVDSLTFDTVASAARSYHVLMSMFTRNLRVITFSLDTISMRINIDVGSIDEGNFNVNRMATEIRAQFNAYALYGLNAVTEGLEAYEAAIAHINENGGGEREYERLNNAIMRTFEEIRASDVDDRIEEMKEHMTDMETTELEGSDYYNALVARIQAIESVARAVKTSNYDKNYQRAKKGLEKLRDRINKARIDIRVAESQAFNGVSLQQTLSRFVSTLIKQQERLKKLGDALLKSFIKYSDNMITQGAKLAMKLK